MARALHEVNRIHNRRQLLHLKPASDVWLVVSHEEGSPHENYGAHFTLRKKKVKLMEVAGISSNATHKPNSTRSKLYVGELSKQIKFECININPGELQPNYYFFAGRHGGVN